MRQKRLFFVVFGAMGLVLLSPLSCVMGFVVASEEPAAVPPSADSIEGELVSPSQASGPIGQPFVFGHVRTYATYRRGGRNPYNSVNYVDEDRGDSLVTLRTATGDVQVELRDPMNTWRNASPEQVSYDSPADVPGWQPQWRPPSAARQYVHYVLAVRTGERLLVDRATGNVWIGGRAESEGMLARHRDKQRAFSIGSFVCSFLIGIASLGSLFVGLRMRS